VAWQAPDVEGNAGNFYWNKAGQFSSDTHRPTQQILPTPHRKRGMRSRQKPKHNKQKTDK